MIGFVIIMVLSIVVIIEFFVINKAILTIGKLTINEDILKNLFVIVMDNLINRYGEDEIRTILVNAFKITANKLNIKTVDELDEEVDDFLKRVKNGGQNI